MKSLEQIIPVSEQIASSLEQNYSTTALGTRRRLYRRVAVSVAHLTVRGKSLPRPRETELRI
jgi:hypothetical protein